MKPETIEMLAMDRAFGELTPEAAELLDAYLLDHPEIAPHTNNVMETVQTARLALTKSPADGAKIIPFDSLCKKQDEAEQRTRWVEWLKLAACIVIGLIAGRWVTSTAHIESTPPVQTAQIIPKPVAPTPLATITSPSSFWAVTNWYPKAKSPPTHKSYTLVWKSPIRRPEIIQETQ